MTDTTFPIPAAAGRGPRRLAGRFPWLMAPAAVFYVVFFGWPLLQMLWSSIWSDGFTFAGYAEFFSEPVYWWVLGYTMVIGVVTLVLTLGIGYPVAYWLVGLNKTWTVVLMAFVLIPFWSSGLVRTYAWLVILGRQGLVNTTLIHIGWIDEPMPFLGTHTAVLVGLTYYLLPYMILCLFSVMNNIDRNLMLAARNLGASPLRAFFAIFVPLTKPGVFAGSFLVFMLAVGMYITPALLGGPDQTTLPLVIALQINEALDWTLAAALSMILLVVSVAIQIFANRYVDFDKMWGGAR
ncbi:ABC transporter permease [Chelatococcus asaccharovorans]|uniref:ABC transporter permease n=1 Tax=Chelatococcus asaccharovorans TaxID=28210 RepID=UPI00224C673D|nr:ABC transporter permease [Chelatococcus asaccharovorans]CAH1649076.1 putative spermidine/putrescine transport system permease protein [Chelatococcus asaccharovorans]CAH1691305.1 putative spermidine/putrescine transport system permease protein [Chelatococcus asaccharovorans]